MAKCRKCRDKKHNVDIAPKKKPRGSIRAAKREEMRRLKKAKLAEAKLAEAADHLPVERPGSDTVS
jgi:hypothetical protein